MNLAKQEVFDLISAANYLDVGALLNCSRKAAANLVPDLTLDSVVDLPSELQTRIREHLPPHALLRAIASQLVPMIPDVRRRVQHAQVWATLFNAQDIALIEHAMLSIHENSPPNVILLGLGLKDHYNRSFNSASESQSHSHIVLILNRFHEFTGSTS